MTNLDDSSAAVLCSAISHAPLQTLNLGYNQIEDEGAQKCAEAFLETPTLHYINLESFEMEPSRSDRLCYLLSKHESLRSLYLSENQLNDDSILKCAKHLATAKSLRKLSLTGNDIQTRGFLGLLSALPQVTSFDFSYNGISLEHIQDEDALMNRISSLETLDLYQNPISDSTMRKILETYIQSRTLKHLGVMLNSEDFGEMIVKLKRAPDEKFHSIQVIE